MGKKILLKKLTMENFRRYGVYADMLNPEISKSGPVSFVPDMARLDLGHSANASFSVTKVEPRKNIINFMEYHTFTGEGILPLDGDIYVHLAPPTPKGVIPMDKVEAFFVPKGTLLSIRMGVWHGAPFAAGSEPVNVMCVLPERTYANDGYFHMVPEDEQIKITNE
jgi:ureidoglycolate lyase